MSSRISKITMEDGSSISFVEKGIDHFKKNSTNESAAKYNFYNQYEDFERKALSYFSLDLEDFAKEEYDLIDSDEQKNIEDYDDSDLLEEAECRGILPVSAQLENLNILNEDYITRFVNIINRGNATEIESSLSFLEFKYKI